MHWWMVPAVLVVLCVLSIIRSWFKSRKVPKWIDVGGVFALPSMAGFGYYLLGLFLIFVAIVFVAGHYLK